MRDSSSSPISPHLVNPAALGVSSLCLSLVLSPSVLSLSFCVFVFLAECLLFVISLLTANVFFPFCFRLRRRSWRFSMIAILCVSRFPWMSPSSPCGTWGPPFPGGPTQRPPRGPLANSPVGFCLGRGLVLSTTRIKEKKPQPSHPMERSTHSTSSSSSSSKQMEGRKPSSNSTRIAAAAAAVGIRQMKSKGENMKRMKRTISLILCHLTRRLSSPSNKRRKRMQQERQKTRLENLPLMSKSTLPGCCSRQMRSSRSSSNNNEKKGAPLGPPGCSNKKQETKRPRERDSRRLLKTESSCPGMRPSTSKVVGLLMLLYSCFLAAAALLLLLLYCCCCCLIGAAAGVAVRCCCCC